MDEGTKTVFIRAAVVLGLSCLAMVLAGYAVAVWVIRPIVDPRVFCHLGTSRLVHDPDSSRIAFPIEVSLTQYTKGPLIALGQRIGLQRRLDVLVYSFDQGTSPRVVYTTPLDRPTGFGIAGWGKDGIHVQYGDRKGYRHVVINPDDGSITTVPQSDSPVVARTLTRAQETLVGSPGYREVKWDDLRCTEKNPRTGRDTLLFDYSKEYAGIPRVTTYEKDMAGEAKGGSR